ncbi:MAG: phosphate ABC transporter permease subunit PstC [Mycobacteriales bacterium]
MTAVLERARTAAPARPRGPVWVPVLSGTGGCLGLLGALLVVGFVAAGLASGEIAWRTLLTTPVWDPPNGIFGVTAMVWGTAAVSTVALALAVPIGWGAAVGLHEQLPPRLSRPLRSAVELLAAVPSIVYGLVGVAVLRPFVSRLGDVPGGDSLLAAGLVLAVMVLPTIVAVSVDALAAVPASVREAAYALGLTRREVIRAAVLPLARPGMRAAVLLGLARALGETIAVFLLIGRADGRLPDPGSALQSLLSPGQTLTTKLGGPEPVLAGAVGEHRAALSAVALLLLLTVAGATLAGSRRGRPARRGARRPAGRWRPGTDHAVTLLRSGAVLLPVLLLGGIVTLLLARGGSALSPSFWWSPAVGSSGGGVRDQIAGTVLLVAAAGAVALPAGLGLGLVLGEYTGARATRALRTATLTLGGVPTILLGLAGYAFFSTALGWSKSWLAGSLVLVVVTMPIVALATAARLDQLAPARREAALALGLTRSQLVRSVLLPHARPAVLTGLLLGLARAAGETAPLLFTATVFAGAATFPSGVVQAPVQALPTHIFTLAQDAADPAALDAAWGSALVLVALAGLLLLAAIPARRRLERA